MRDTCSKHNIPLVCMGGRSAHPSNWYCQKCDEEKSDCSQHTAELRCCPHCGGTPKWTHHTNTFAGEKIMSLHCCASIVGSEAEVAAKWNARPSELESQLSKKAVIGQYLIDSNGDKQGTIIGHAHWPKIVADAGLTGQWMELSFMPIAKAGVDV